MNDEIEYLRKVYQSEDTSTWVNKLQMKSIIDYADKLQSNWNSLREWVMQLKNSYMETDNIFDDAKFRILLTVLDKMNELEGEKNEKEK